MLVVEVISPSSRWMDPLVKRAKYQAAGVPAYWIADPTVPRLTVLELERGEYVERAVVQQQDVTLALPFPVTRPPARTADGGLIRHRRRSLRRMGSAPRTAPEDLSAAIEHLQAAGASFAYLHGSRASGTARSGSDVDIAAWFGRPVDSWVVSRGLPEAVDLLVLDTAPLELAGRVALRGRLLFEVDPAVRVAWEATTRKIYLDEQPRQEQARRDFAAARRRG